VTDNNGEVTMPHGYTLAQLDRVAREAAYGSRWRFLSIAERIDVARFAILEHLYTCDEPGDFWAVVRLGRQAINAHVVKEMHHRGMTPKTKDPGVAPLPRYWTYWRSTSVPTRSPEDPVVQALALMQILPRLTDTHQRVLLALAEHDDYHAAAASLGKAYHGFETTLSTARKLFLQWWHEGETPSRVWGRDHRNARRRNARRRNERVDYKKITMTTIRRRRQRKAKEAASHRGNRESRPHRANRERRHTAPLSAPPEGGEGMAIRHRPGQPPDPEPPDPYQSSHNE
jgi:hypothetical protein